MDAFSRNVRHAVRGFLRTPALIKSEITAALVTAMILFANGFLSGFGDVQRRWSPLFNPLRGAEANSSELLAWMIQNRIGVALLILALILLSCVRARGAARAAPQNLTEGATTDYWRPAARLYGVTMTLRSRAVRATSLMHLIS